jgi:ABC-2 type transport system permease protein
VIGVELASLLRRPRTWVAIALLCGLPTAVAVVVHVSGLAPRPGQGPAFLAQIFTNGALFAPAALALVMPVFLPAAVSVVAGDAVAGEASAGTLRYLLVRPAGRTRLLVAKLLSSAVFVLMAVVIVAVVGYVVGTRLFGSGHAAAYGIVGRSGVVPLSGGVPMSQAELTTRFVGAVLYIGLSMLGVAAIALFLSTLTDSGLAASLGAVAVVLTSQALDVLDAAGMLRPYLPTHYWLSFIDFFRNPVLWSDIERGLLLQGGYVVVLLGASWAWFTTKDITS